MRIPFRHHPHGANNEARTRNIQLGRLALYQIELCSQLEIRLFRLGSLLAPEHYQAAL